MIQFEPIWCVKAFIKSEARYQSQLSIDTRNMSDVKTSELCRDFIANFVKENNYDNDYKITPISTEGANYTSHLFITTLTKDGKPVDLFTKVAAVGEKMREQNPIRMYDNEILFYTKVAKFFNKLEEKHNVPEEHRLRIPKFYTCDPTFLEEIVVLEDLTKSGFTTHDRLEIVDWEYAAAAVTQLAKYHALTVAYSLYYPEEFQKVAENIKFDFEQTEQHQSFYDMTVAKALAVTREENKDRLKKFLTKRMLNIDVFVDYYKPSTLKTITHGDYRPSNLMHRKLEDGSVEVIPVDFQTTQIGSPITDLLYFIISATDKAFRKDHYDELIDHYYTQLSSAMARLGLDPEEIYSREDFERELKEKKDFGLCISTFVLPIVTVDSKNAPKMDKDMELADFSVQPGDQFADRFNGVVDDYIRWGDL